MTDWTQAEDTLLENLVKSGMSFGLIITQLTGRTRNSAIGRANRRDFRPAIPHKTRGTGQTTLQAAPSRTLRTPRTPRKLLVPRPRPKPVLIPPKSPRNAPRGAANAVVALRSNQCKWPIGEPQSARFRFCLCVVATPPYCEEHTRVAYRTREPNARRVR